jgi:hypothetical protein
MRIRNTGQDCHGFILNILYAENTPAVPVFKIRMGFNVDPDPAMYVHAAPDPAPGFVIKLEVKIPIFFN